MLLLLVAAVLIYFIHFFVLFLYFVKKSGFVDASVLNIIVGTVNKTCFLCSQKVIKRHFSTLACSPL